jgi:RimJ/RimL family protein N-acetyltransferase
LKPQRFEIGAGCLSVDTLQTRRLTLRPCSPADLADFIGLECDPEVMRYLNGGYAVDRARCTGGETFLMPDGTESCVWTARRRDNGAFVGWFCLWPESEEVAELGYRLRRDAWGQGLATEGTAALVGWGFAAHEYERIFAVTMAVNHASRRMLEKIGFRHTRTIPIACPDPFPGTEHGDAEYELLRSYWTSG